MIKVKINDYFPKIDAIPYDNYFCIISCNNSYSKFKLIEHKYQCYQHSFSMIKNTDLLFNIKLINYLENNTLIGIYDLIIPYTKINEIIKRNNYTFQQQIKLIMNSNVKIKLFGTMMNITSIYLDLIFELSLLNNYNNQINKYRIYDILGKDSSAEPIKKNIKRKFFSENFNNNRIIPKKSISFSKSPLITYILDEDFHVNDNYLFNDSYNNSRFSRHKRNSDINFNILNNNYLNYFKIDNNSFNLNHKYKINNRTPSNITYKYINLDNIENDNNSKINHYDKDELYYNNNLYNSTIKQQRGKKYIKINNNNINRKNRAKNKSFKSPFIMHTERNNNNLYGKRNNLKYNYIKNLTEVKNNLDKDFLMNERKKFEKNAKKNLKYLNINNNLNNNNNINTSGNYINYINNKQPILYDKKNNIEKYISNRLIKKIPTSFKNNKVKNDIGKKKKHVYENQINSSETQNNRTFNLIIKTPKRIKESNSNIISNDNNLFSLSTINRNSNEFDSIQFINNGKKVIDINAEKKEKKYSQQNTNYKNLNKYPIIKTKTEPIIKSDKKIKDYMNINDVNNLLKITSDKKNDINILNENSNNFYNKEICENKLLFYTQEEIKDKIIELIDKNYKLTKDINQKIKANKKLMKKYLLCKEKYYTELKINNRFYNKINLEEMKYSIHVNIRGKLNNKLYFAMNNIKKMESKIFLNIFYDHKNSPEYKAKEAKKKAQEKLEQQKKVHTLLKIIRELIQKYENLSQLYNDDEKKKILFKSLLLRYSIREKEENKENNLMDKFREIQKKIEKEKNNDLIKIKAREIQNDVYKSVIKEESDEDKSSISERLKRGYSFKKKLSWTSNDSFLKDKDNFDINKSNNNEEINNSLMSSGLKIIKERNEDIIKEKENNSNNLLNDDDDEKKTVNKNLNEIF